MFVPRLLTCVIQAGSSPDSRERVEIVMTLSLLIVEAFGLSTVFNCIPLNE
jgi:hypothetical protein